MLKLDLSPDYRVYLHECIFSVDHFLKPLLSQLPNRFCVDLGAADGQNGSNTFLLFLNHWPGLAIEREPRYFQAMREAYLRLGLPVRLLCEQVNADNILFLLASEETPQEFAFLSLDIDSWDYWVLKQLLSSYRPILICTEINETLPPPLRFTLNPQQQPWAPAHFFGYSLALLQDLAEACAYDLVCLDFNNAFLVAREYNQFWPALSAEACYQYYRSHPRPDYNADMEPLLQLSPSAALDFLHRHFAAFAGGYQLWLPT